MPASEPARAPQPAPSTAAQLQGQGTPLTLCLCGLLAVFISAFPVLSALDIGIHQDDSAFGAERWLVALLASSFTWVGMMLFTAGLAVYMKPAFPVLARWLEHASALFGALLLLSFLGGIVIFLNWQVIKPTGAQGQVSVGGVSVPLPPFVQRIVDRAFIAFIALLLDVILLSALWQAAKDLLRKRSPDRGDT